MGSIVGSVSGIGIYPVKSMQGGSVDECVVTEQGFVGDRAYALVDNETGKVASAKSVRLYPNLLGCTAAYVETPQAGADLPVVRITLPDGTEVMSDADNVNSVLSDFCGRGVTLASSAPDDFTIDQYHPDIEDADPRGHRDTMVEQKLGSAFFAEIGMDSPVAAGSFFDLFPASVVTTSTLRKLRKLGPDSDFDERRFRMNLTVDTSTDGFVENDWLEKQLNIGDEVVMVAAMADPRCVMTTLAQGDLPQDRGNLRTVVLHNRVEVAGAGLFPCVGVYAVVPAPGTVRVGDPVTVS